jgi:hypothetical protein
MPSSRRTETRFLVERPAGELFKAWNVDAFGEPQAHQQKFVGLLAPVRGFPLR